MAEEIKKNVAAKNTTAAKATATDKAKTYSQEEVDAKISAAVAEAVAKALQQVKADSSNNQTATVIQVKNDETVTVLYMGAVADGTVIWLADGLGQLNGAGSPLDIPKKEFFQKLNLKMRKMLADRRLIIVDGLTDEERKRYGVDYKEGELVSQDMYYKLLDYTPDELKTIYPKLCESHKRAVAKMFLTAYDNGDNKVSIEKVKVINDLSKEIDADGLLTPVLEAMGKKLAK